MDFNHKIRFVASGHNASTDVIYISSIVSSDRIRIGMARMDKDIKTWNLKVANWNTPC